MVLNLLNLNMEIYEAFCWQFWQNVVCVNEIGWMVWLQCASGSWHCPVNTLLVWSISCMLEHANLINQNCLLLSMEMFLSFQVFKYKKETEEKFGDKIAKLNLHSLKKKSTRLRARLSTNLGISLQVNVYYTFHLFCLVWYWCKVTGFTLGYVKG